MLFLQPIMAEAQTNLQPHSPTREREKETHAREPCTALHGPAPRKTTAANNTTGRAPVPQSVAAASLSSSARRLFVRSFACTDSDACRRTRAMHACMHAWSGRSRAYTPVFVPRHALGLPPFSAESLLSLSGVV